MFSKVNDARFVAGEHACLRFWDETRVFDRLREKNATAPRWSFLDGPITANNPMGVHHAWGRTYKDAYQRFFAMKGHRLRYQNGFDCQGLWVEVEVEKELELGTKTAILEYGVDEFVNECKRRVLRFAARQTEQSVRLGYWMDWDDPDTLRELAEHLGTDTPVTITAPSGETATDAAHRLVEKLGNPAWGGSYFTFSTENNETIWAFLKKCHDRGKIYRGHDVMPWGGRAGSAYSQMEIADGRRLTTHQSVFVRFPIVRESEGDGDEVKSQESRVESQTDAPTQADAPASDSGSGSSTLDSRPDEYLLVWTTTPWTLTSNVAAAVNPELDYVKLQSKRDDAIYYFAKDNLDYKRLETEFKEGFGRPEWKWPDGVPKLKTIAQLFKEQGGYEVLGTLKGAEMVGWRYRGPFDDLPVQRTPEGFTSGDPESHARLATVSEEMGRSGDGEPSESPHLLTASSPHHPASAAGVHRVIDGGRDSRGNAHVVAGEGTGIVHIAPGCGDVDNKIGEQLGLPIIAPLKEDGTFDEGFGPFTGREAVGEGTPELVFEQLRENGFLVAVETYPHVYPHCWRTGEELVFRLVDEWFVNMDWRQEIVDVAKSIEWLPESVNGEEEEIRWLTNMRDWMISKKRVWGLALPFWINPDDPTDFEVIGSLAELKERAVEGWDVLEGNSPHRPWIDAVKIRSERTGAILERIPDVGNPWLDAGIVPFSTLNYNERYPTDLLKWSDWFPAQFVTECFPGQFRNWFYSLLALATMTRYDETDDPREKRPFETLLGHRLVADEHGQPMHKSDGTAIWFEEAAEQIGVDTLRWMYLAQNPAQDLRFGLRHPDEPVTLDTPEGPISQTKEGLPTCKVTSTPADEIRRQILIPLWNSYKFLVNYAALDEFDPTAEPLPVKDRSPGDQWILSNLQEFLAAANDRFAAFDAAAVCTAAASFLDDLSNWYIRRNKARFWSKQGEGDARDKLAAYQTLYEVLLTLSKALAPAVPFLAERMYQNLVFGRDLVDGDEPESGSGLSTLDSRLEHSVHLCDYPQPDESLLDPELNEAAKNAQRLVRLVHRLRDDAGHRVRQPLAEVKFATEFRVADHVQGLADVVMDEVNVKKLTRVDSLDEYASYSAKPNKKTLGPKYGKLLGLLSKQLPGVDDALLAPLRSGAESVTLELDGHTIVLTPDDVLFEIETASGWSVAEEGDLRAALDTTLTPELVHEGMSRDLIRHVQQRRKDADLDENAPIAIHYATDDADAKAAVDEWQETIRTETRATTITPGDTPPPAEKPVTVGPTKLTVWITAE